MVLVEVRDHVLWAKHIHGDNGLRALIEELPQGELIELVVDNERGVWEKMADGADGRSTPGIKPLGKAREFWHMLQEQRGELVLISEA